MKAKDKNHILILIPGENARGGIPAYYKSLEPLFDLPIHYIERGSRNWPERKKSLVELKRIIIDYYRFIKAIRTGKYSLVITNTSFSSLAIIRDGLYLIIARLYGLKTIVFFRGWDYAFADKIKRRYFRIFKIVYFKSNAIIDLARKNIICLKAWGYERQTYLETAVVDIKSLKNVDENQIAAKFLKKDLNLLFLARIEIAKGIYEALETFVILKKQYPVLKMIVAGNGKELNNIKKYIRSAKIDDITLTGFIEGEQKTSIFASADIYLFPSYNEGMPSSLAEAMAFGLPVVTRNVGGISDFFINEKYGYITESKDPVVLASLVELLILNRDNARIMALNNYNFAKERFYSDKVVNRIDQIMLEVLNS